MSTIHPKPADDIIALFPSKAIIFGLVFSVLFSGTIFLAATYYMGIATFAYCLMCIGVLYRKYTPLHWKFMTSAMTIDLTLVLTLEISRNAIKTALAFKLTPFQQIHIIMSLCAVILYFPILYLGFKGLKKELSEKSRKKHITLGVTAFIFRSLGFIFMFSLIGIHK